MKISAPLRIAARFASKNGTREELMTVAVTPKYVEATDGCSLIRIEHGPNDGDIVSAGRVHVDADKLKGLTSKADGLAIDAKGLDNWPNVDAILPTNKPIASVTLNAEYLERMAKAMKDLKSRNARLTIELRGDGKPVLFRAKTGDDKDILGAIMPIVKR